MERRAGADQDADGKLRRRSRSGLGIVWQEDLFAPADEDARYTTDVEAHLGAQHEWMVNHLPKRGAIVEVNEWGQPKLPVKPPAWQARQIRPHRDVS